MASAGVSSLDRAHWLTGSECESNMAATGGNGFALETSHPGKREKSPAEPHARLHKAFKLIFKDIDMLQITLPGFWQCSEIDCTNPFPCTMHRNHTAWNNLRFVVTVHRQALQSTLVPASVHALTFARHTLDSILC